MKKLSHFIVLFFSIIYQNSQAQTDILHDSRVDPLLKQAAAGQPGLVISGRKDASRYVNMAVLDRNRKTLTLFTCHGSAYDSAQLLDIEYTISFPRPSILLTFIKIFAWRTFLTWKMRSHNSGSWVTQP
ncbi:hypothetical protein [Chitinophaga sp. GbtcB8]|uniref:hypothetical protein n=1 Tax=Chitinophaga sp. GbtcB8 TaxID=2824753 RepID=UPI001C302FCA|nr:hypothetical protein [Chitinophaga sp. GbtcB8]